MRPFDGRRGRRAGQLLELRSTEAHNRSITRLYISKVLNRPVVLAAKGSVAYYE